MRSRLHAFVIFLALGLLAGCGTPGPPRPAMVAFDTNGDYGFSETRLGAAEYQVRYVEPRVRVSNDRASRESAIEQSKQRSYDLALLRATQLAEDEGYTVLQVLRERRDADVDITERRYRNAFGGFGYFGNPYYIHRPWFPYHYDEYPYSPYYGDYEAAYARVSATLTVKFLKESGAGALDVAETSASLQQRYAGVTFPPR